MNKQNKKSEYAEQEVLETLENLETLPKLKASPHFGAKVEAQINRLNSSTQVITRPFWQPILLQAAMVLLLIGLNGLVLVNTWNIGPKPKGDSQRGLTINDFISEYGLNSSSKDMYPLFQ